MLDGMPMHFENELLADMRRTNGNWPSFMYSRTLVLAGVST